MEDLLADLLSKDPMRIWSASCAVRTLRDKQELVRLASNLEKIRQSALSVPLGGALRPNSTHLEFALVKLAFVRSPNGCLCSLYLQDDFYDPQPEQKAGNLRILSTNDQERSLVCQCCLCESKFLVYERDYHYSWWEWKRIE
jgi:hypothetical protein